MFGWSNKKVNLHRKNNVQSFSDELSCFAGILYKSQKLTVPKSMQNKMLKEASNLTCRNCGNKNRTIHSLLEWYGKMLKNIVRSNATCARYVYRGCNPEETMIPSKLPARLLSRNGMKLFELGENHYWLVGNNLSKLPDWVPLVYIKFTFGQMLLRPF